MTLPVALSDQERSSLYQGLPEEATLVGGLALKWWADRYGLVFGAKGAPITQDADFLGHPQTLYDIQAQWGGKVLLVPEQSLSALIGQVHKVTPETGHGHMNVDVIHCVFGLRTEEILKQRVLAEDQGHRFYVLHPLHVMEARLENLAGIASKQTEHGALQAELGVRVGRAYLQELCQAAQDDPTQERKLLNALNRVVTLARTDRLQGAAKAWGIDMLDAFPIDEISHAGFRDQQWPRIQARASTIPPSATAGGPHARPAHAPRPRRHR